MAATDEGMFVGYGGAGASTVCAFVERPFDAVCEVLRPSLEEWSGLAVPAGVGVRRVSNAVATIHLDGIELRAVRVSSGGHAVTELLLVRDRHNGSDLANTRARQALEAFADLLERKIPATGGILASA
jgi:hypothetical protein